MTETESTDIVPRPASAVEAAARGEVSLDSAVRMVLPTPLPDERYHVRGLTELWVTTVIGRDSEHTRKAYEFGLTLWLDYCLRASVDPLTARRADVDDWTATHLAGKSAETIHQRLAAVGNWYHYLIDNDIDVRNPVARVKRPKRQPNKSATHYLDVDELNALMAEADQRLEEAKKIGGLALEIAARDVAVLRVLFTTAVRSGAVQLATVQDVRLVVDGHRVLRFHGKGDAGQTTVRLKPLVPWAAVALDYYHGLVAARLGVPFDELDGLAFRTTPYHGQPGGSGLRSDALGSMIRSIAASADIATDAGIVKSKAAKITPHWLRHTAATLLGREKSPAEVQDFLDHADPRTTRIYLHTEQSLNSSLAYSTMAFIRDSATDGTS
ncbi:site-specific recombinase XerD [Lentzea atacamensis]|uniref:Site-specific recombinase XerD n=1 Tax=Lentzea atacamensis TaxID=531938 RepID=A0ABX9DWB3_9PSEU|nr:tyrosine-type recombinase/integrase [Lentzea atacamensis]RAS59392.1 site-specific recombinase XerD [Lentzea atacamensis]